MPEPTVGLADPQPGTLMMIPVDKLRPAPDNLRRKIRADSQKFKELVASVRARGVLQPLLVTPLDDGTFLISAGARRREAALEAGLAELPCVIKEQDEADRVEAAIIENGHRADLTPMEQARGFFRLVELGRPLEEVARRLGYSARLIRERVALLDLPKRAQTMIDKGELPLVGAGELLRLVEHPERLNELLDNPPRNGDWHWHVDRMLSAVKADAAVAKARELAATARYPVVEFSNYIPHNIKTTAIGNDHGDLDVDKGRHRREPCHAIAIITGHRPHSAEVCVDPARHGPRGSSPLKSTRRTQDDERRSASRAAARERRAVLQARLEVEDQLLGRRVPEQMVRHLVFSAYLAGMSYQDASQLGKRLGLEPAEGGMGREWDTAICAFVDESDANLRKAVFALAFIQGGQVWESAWSPARKRFRLLLRSLLRDAGLEVEDDPPLLPTPPRPSRHATAPACTDPPR